MKAEELVAFEKDIADSFNSAKIKASKNDTIYVGGSTFVVAEII